MIGSKKSIGKQKFWVVKIILCPKNFWSKKFGSKKIWGPKTFGSTKTFESIKILSPKKDYRKMLSVTEIGWLPTLRMTGINLLSSVTDDISCSLFKHFLKWL